MNTCSDSPPETLPPGLASGRDRLERIRFTSTEAQRQAIRVLLDREMLNFASDRQDEWLVRTPVARTLRERGIPFEWVSEHA